jgi:hypothetical protein
MTSLFPVYVNTEQVLPVTSLHAEEDEVYIRKYEMDPKKIGDMAGRLRTGSKGLGAGAGFLAAAGAVVYGVSQSIYTGTCSAPARADEFVKFHSK